MFPCRVGPIFALALGCATVLIPAPARGDCQELIDNGSFLSDTLGPWKVDSIPPTSLLSVSFFQGLRVSIPDPQFQSYTVEISQVVPIQTGSSYHVSFFIESPPAAEAHVLVGNATNRTRAYGLNRDLTKADGSEAGSNYATYAMPFVATATDPRAKFVISFTNDAGFNPFARITGVSMVQTSGSCYDGSSEAEQSPDGSSEPEQSPDGSPEPDQSPDGPPEAHQPPDGSVNAASAGPDSGPPRSTFATARGCACALGEVDGSANSAVVVLFAILLLAGTCRSKLRRSRDACRVGPAFRDMR